MSRSPKPRPRRATGAAPDAGGAPELLTTRQTATLAQVSRSAVQRWCDAGALPSKRTPGGHRRIGARALVAFLRGRGMPVPPGLDREPRLLVVDAAPGYLAALRAALAAARSRVAVEAHADLRAALLSLGARPPDAVLLDAATAGPATALACRAIKRLPETRHVAVLGLLAPRRDGAARLRAAGAARVLTRPVRVPRLLEALAELGLVGAPAR